MADVHFDIYVEKGIHRRTNPLTDVHVEKVSGNTNMVVVKILIPVKLLFSGVLRVDMVTVPKGYIPPLRENMDMKDICMGPQKIGGVQEDYIDRLKAVLKVSI